MLLYIACFYQPNQLGIKGQNEVISCLMIYRQTAKYTNYRFFNCNIFPALRKIYDSSQELKELEKEIEIVYCL